LLSKNLKIKIYRTRILPVVLYECEAWSLVLREERRLKVFENRVLRSVLVPKRDELRGEWRKCLLLFGSESFVFQIAIQKFKDQDI
jgi:hypothetical protein